MIEFVQEVDNSNRDEILARYQALGWGVGKEYFRNWYAVAVQFIWPREEPAIFPDLTDLFPPTSQ